MRINQNRWKFALYGAAGIAIGILLGAGLYLIQVGGHRPAYWMYCWPVASVLLGLTHVAYAFELTKSAKWLLIAGTSTLVGMSGYLLFDKEFIRCSRLALYYGVKEPQVVCSAAFVVAAIGIAHIFLWIGIGFAQVVRPGFSVRKTSSRSADVAPVIKR